MKKRFLSLLMALALVMSMFSAVTLSAYAKDTAMEVVANEDYEDLYDDAVMSKDGGYEYVVRESKAVIVSCLLPELSTNYTVPQAIDGYPVVAIAESAYLGIPEMKNLTIPDGIEKIGEDAFYLTEIETLNIGKDVKVIGAAAFAGCEGLANINVDADNTSFVAVDNVLYTKDMETLVQYPVAKDAIEFEIPSTVTKIGNSAFELSNLESIVIPSNVIEIDSYAFYDCFSLAEVILNENLQIIGEGAFDFTCIETITIPASVTSIGVYAFDDIDCLKEINVVNTNENYCSVNGVLFSKDMKEFVKYPEGKTATTYTIPDGVETLKGYAFNFVTLESITIPDTVVNFEEDVFYGSEEIVIVCSKNSKAAEYAEENGLNVRYTDVVIATSLVLNAATIKWPVGKAGSFKPTVLPAEASQELSWTSSNPAVATVDANGKLTAVSVGTATITCKTTDGSNLSATCKVTVGALVSSLKLNAATINWPVGKAGHFKPTVAPSNAANKTLSWTSSNSNVATVDANGKLTAVAVGTAVITCKTTDGSNLSATCRVTVRDNNTATSLKLNANTINWSIGKSGHFKPTVLPAEASQTLSWTSSNTNVATVNENGKLTAVGVGTTTITCKTTDGSNLTATCTVTVGRLVTSVKLNATTINWPVGKAGSFKPTVSPSNAVNKTLSWTSSNPAVATVDANGKLTAVSAGTTTITCKATDGSGKSATCKVTVTTVKVSSLKLNATTINWPAGKAGSFKPTVSPSNAANKTLSWTSSNPAVATVDANGKLTAKAPGTATITCKTTDGSNLSATCKVTVTAVKVTSLALNAKSIVWEVGKSGSFKPTVSPSNATNQTLKWESLNPDVATVSSAGKLTAKAPGTAKIVCKTTDGSNLTAYCQVMVTKSGEPTNYTNFFKSFNHDGTYAINGYTYVEDETGSYKMRVQLGVTPTQSYMYEYDVADQTAKSVFGPDGSIIIMYGLKLSEIFTLSEAKQLGLPTQYFYSAKDYYIVYDETPFNNFYLENLTYKYTDTDVINDVEYTAEHFRAKGEDAESVFYFKDGSLRYFEMKNGNDSILIEVTGAQGTFYYSDYKKPSGCIEIDLGAWFDIV